MAGIERVLYLYRRVSVGALASLKDPRFRGRGSDGIEREGVVGWHGAELPAPRRHGSQGPSGLSPGQRAP